jgi:ribosome-binding factor A
MSYSRAERVSTLIRQALSDILKKRIKDPRLKMITITGVKMSRDLRVARIYFATSSGPEHAADATRAFNSASGFIKRILAREIELRYMPDISFFYDESYDYGAHIEELLKSVMSEDGSDPTTN